MGAVPLTPADARDAAASQRDASAEERDCRAVTRDRRARELDADGDPGFAARYLAAVDRDSAAGDRAEALADRKHGSYQRASATVTHVPSTESPDGSADAVVERRCQATAPGLGATTPYFSDEPDRPGGLTPTPPSGRMPSGAGDPTGGLAAVLARRHLVRQAQGMVMAARQVSAEDASCMLLEALDPDGQSLLDVAGALVAATPRRPLRTPYAVDGALGGGAAETRRTP